MTKHTLTVRLNGTDTNPWHVLHLRCNPFPQIARHEFMAGEMALNELNGDPLRGPEDIRERLSGKVSEELIQLCIQQFVPSKLVQFDIEFEE
jgi:hypothetical protein